MHRKLGAGEVAPRLVVVGRRRAFVRSEFREWLRLSEQIGHLPSAVEWAQHNA